MDNNKKTKIVCTIGPACNDVEILKQMIKAGMNVARFNMSHGSHESHHELIEKVKQARTELGASVGLMIDTNGPEIRLGEFENFSVDLKKGDNFTFVTKKCMGTKEKCFVSVKSFAKLVKVGTIIYANDGLVKLQVESVFDDSVNCKVLIGGVLSNRKSLNIPGLVLDTPYLGKADKEHLLFGIKEGADIYSLSFVCNKKDVIDVRNFLKKNGEDNAILCAKIESELGVRNLDEIIEVSDAVMVARGDLGVEIPFEQIPNVQNDIISKCVKSGKTVITATEMLESMINNPRPTRAEISDVANAVEDGSSAVMLSGETSAGKHPVLCVQTMAKIVQEREKTMNYGKTTDFTKSESVEESIGHVACSLARSLDAKAIIVATNTGVTAKNTSRFRPACPIVACTPNSRAFYKMSIYWGVYPLLDKECKNSKDLLEETRQTALVAGFVDRGDLVVQTTSIETPKPSDMVTVSTI